MKLCGGLELSAVDSALEHALFFTIQQPQL